MPEPPFPNSYRCRRVADRDARPCYICFKPTTSVMVSANKADFFYICSSHLKDTSFACPVHSEEYTSLLQAKAKLESDVRNANEIAEANKPYSWNKLMTNIGWKETRDLKNTEGQSKADEKKDDEPTTDTAKTDTYQVYVDRGNRLKKDLIDVNSSIAQYTFKEYTLNKDIYRNRVNAVIQSQVRAKRQQEIQSGAIFPTTPNTSIG